LRSALPLAKARIVGYADYELFNFELRFLGFKARNYINDNNKNGWQFAPSELSTIFFEKVLSFGFNVVDLW